MAVFPVEPFHLHFLCICSTFWRRAFWDKLHRIYHHVTAVIDPSASTATTTFSFLRNWLFLGLLWASWGPSTENLYEQCNRRHQNSALSSQVLSPAYGKAGNFVLVHRTLPGRAGELIEALTDREVDVACFQETRWRGSGCKFFGAKGWLMIRIGVSRWMFLLIPAYPWSPCSPTASCQSLHLGLWSS